MPLVIKDRVQETTTTTGTGTITLAGAVSGFQSFSVIGDSNTTFYSIVGGTEWELGIGTYTSSGTTLSRNTILESSNGGTAVNFSAGTKTVFCTYPAERSVYVDGSSIVPGATASLPVVSGGTGQTTYTDGQLLIGNTTGNTLTKATLTQGSGVTITNGSGSITISASGGGATGYGDVGTYATLHNTSTTATYSAGATESGSSLAVSCAIRTTTAQTASTTAAPAGTWRVMSNYNNNIANKSILVGTWLRIA
jgi:hypothetical protein